MNGPIGRFVDRGEHAMFTAYFPAAVEQPRFAVVLVNAFASETEIFRVHFVHFGRALAAAGIPALRFDYVGYGDSQGDFEAACPASMEADIEAAIEEAKRRSGASRVVLVGLRFGATLAARVAARRDDVEQLVLWEPLVKPWDDLFAQLRATVSMQTVLFKDVKATRDQIVENLLAGRPTMVGGYDLNVIDDGYPLGREMVEQTKRIDLLNEGTSRARTLVLHVRRNPGQPSKKLVEYRDRLAQQGVDVTLDTVVESTLPWLHEATYSTMSPNLYRTTLDFLGAGRERERNVDSVVEAP
ncbi:MAG: alpha/beta fold hydrolase [Polyangiaceae bacterium]|nr:alpha/beta fold hydrolase [Polyangiaceae bacterium]